MGESDRRISVNGELFSVSFEGKTLHATWLSGPVPDYGFSTRPHEETISDADLAREIRVFLDQVGADGLIE